MSFIHEDFQILDTSFIKHEAVDQRNTEVM